MTPWWPSVFASRSRRAIETTLHRDALALGLELDRVEHVGGVLALGDEDLLHGAPPRAQQLEDGVATLDLIATDALAVARRPSRRVRAARHDDRPGATGASRRRGAARDAGSRVLVERARRRSRQCPRPRPSAPSPSIVVAFTETSRADDARELVGHRGHVERELRPLGDDRHVGRERRGTPRRCTSVDRRLEQSTRRHVAIRGVVVGKVAAEVAEVRRAEQRVAERVGRDVGVGVALEARGVRARGRGRARAARPGRSLTRWTSMPWPILTGGSASDASTSRSSAWVILRLRRLAGDDDDAPAERLDERGVVAGVVAFGVRALEQSSRRNAWGVWTVTSSSRARVAATTVASPSRRRASRCR